MTDETKQPQLPARTIDRFPMPRQQRENTQLFETSAGTRLTAAVEGLYFAFRICRLDEDFSFCSHCFTVSDGMYLRTTPLRRISLDEAAFILTKCPGTLGCARDFNYFLPRIFEAWAHRAHYLAEVIPDRLEAAREEGWTPEQVAAVAEFMRAFFGAINISDLNIAWCYELESEIEKLKKVVPEAADAVYLVERGSDSSECGGAGLT
jgi:hypothetical protein